MAASVFGVLRALFVAVPLWAILTVPQASAQSDNASQASGKTLTIGITQFPHSFHPSFDSMAATRYILGFARRPLTAYDAQWRLTCMLCEQVPTLENGLAKVIDLPTDVGDGSGKGMEVTYRLRDGVVWADGTPITSKDVLFTWEVGKHPSTGYASAEGFRRILDVKIIDARTFTFVQDRVNFAYASAGSFRLLPEHLEAAAFATPETYRQNSLYQTAPTTPGLWSGPWRLASVERGVQLVLERNPAWWGDAPAFDRVVIKAVENTAALEANLLSGAVDMIAGEVGLDLDQVMALEQRAGDRFAFVYRPALYYEHLEPRLDSPQLSDLRVRQALMMGMDRKTISDRLFAGKAPVAATSVNPLDWVHDAEVTPHPYAPEQAKALLDEAGWLPGPDGIRVKDGDRLSITLQTTAGNRTRERVEQVLQAQWKVIGVDVQIRNEPARVLFGETLDKRKFQGLMLFAWISSPESPPRTTLHCDEIPGPDNGWKGQNYAGYCNPEMDRLIDAVEVELDETKRAAIWKDIQDLYYRDLPALPLYFRAEAFVLPQWLRGLSPTGHMDYSSLWSEQWRDGRAQ